MCDKLRMNFIISACLLCFAGLIVMFAQPVYALPWDIDMFRQQSYKAGEMSRAPVKGTVPVGRKPFTMTTEEAEKNLKNPVAFNQNSVWRGQRLWNANCYSCHGKTGKGEGPVGPQLAVPNLLDEFYAKSSDGKVFGVINNGGANMPRYGYKFSREESWHLVNYLRFLQGKDVEGINRPQ